MTRRTLNLNGILILVIVTMVGWRDVARAQYGGERLALPQIEEKYYTLRALDANHYRLQISLPDGSSRSEVIAFAQGELSVKGTLHTFDPHSGLSAIWHYVADRNGNNVKYELATMLQGPLGLSASALKTFAG